MYDTLISQQKQTNKKNKASGSGKRKTSLYLLPGSREHVSLWSGVIVLGVTEAGYRWRRVEVRWDGTLIVTE